MRSVLVVVLLATAFHASVKCGDSSGTNLETVMKELQQMKLNQQTYQKQLQQSQELISTLLTELNRMRGYQQQQQLQPQVQPQVQSQVQPQFDWRSADYQWVSWSVGQKIPQRAVFAGYNWNKGELYVARARHNGEDFVAKASPKENNCYFGYGGSVIHLKKCEVLTGSGFSWVFSSDGALPANAFPCGTKANGQLQYIGRVDHPWPNVPNSRTPGNIDASDGILSIAFAANEYKYSTYDVLVVN